MYFLPVFSLLLAYVSAQVYVIPSASWTTETPITANNVYSMAGSCARECVTKMYSSWSSYLSAIAPDTECNVFPNCMCTKANTDISRGIASCVSTQSCSAQDVSLATAIFGKYCAANMGFATAGSAPTNAAAPANTASSSASPSSNASIVTRTTSGTTTATATVASAVAATRQSTTASVAQATSTSKSGSGKLLSMGAVEYLALFCATILLSY